MQVNVDRYIQGIPFNMDPLNVELNVGQPLKKRLHFPCQRGGSYHNQRIRHCFDVYSPQIGLEFQKTTKEKAQILPKRCSAHTNFLGIR